MSDEVNPFAPPSTTSSAPEPRSRSGGRHRYQSAAALAIWTMVMLALTLLINLSIVGLDVQVKGLLESMRRGVQPNPQTAERIVTLFDAANTANVLILVLTAVAYLWWSYRMHRNLRALGVTRLELSSGWAIGGFFVPIMNLFRPCEVMCEVARGSDPQAYSSTFHHWNRGQVTPLVGFWWALFLLKNIVAQVAQVMFKTTSDKSSAVNAEMTAQFLSAVAAVITILMIRRLTQNQEQRYAICEQLREAEAAGDSPFQTPSNPWEAGFTG